MKDPIQGTLDAVREVEIRVGQIRLLWAEAERASAAEVETLRAELARKDEDVERFRARAEQELKRLRRSNEQVREVLGANHGESPVEAAERAVLYEDREAVVAEKLAGLLGNVNLACYGVDDLIERLRDELSTIDWMGSVKRMAGG